MGLLDLHDGPGLDLPGLRVLDAIKETLALLFPCFAFFADAPLVQGEGGDEESGDDRGHDTSSIP